ncbi:MAG: hypothetical protein V1492_04975 [Candidatus Micrarchaeota archaeon]
MGFIARRLEHKYASRLKEASDFVRKYYGLPERPLPRLVIGTPTNEELERSRMEFHCNNPWAGPYTVLSWSQKLRRRILHKKAEFTFSGEYRYADMSIHIPFRNALFGLNTRILPLLIHETTHHYSAGTPLRRAAIVAETYYHEAIAEACIEGLAVMCEVNASLTAKEPFLIADLKRTIRNWKNSLQTLLETISSPYASFFRSIYIPYLVKRYDALRFATFIEKYPSLTRYLDEYIIGYKFAKAMVDKIGDPKKVFRLICDYPPKMISEVLYPKFYWHGRQKEMEKMGITLQADSDTKQS